MMKLRGTKSDLEKLAAEIDRVSKVAEIQQVEIGGGIHGAPPVLTRGVPVLDGADMVYAVDETLDAKVVTDAVATTKVEVVEAEPVK